MSDQKSYARIVGRFSGVRRYARRGVASVGLLLALGAAGPTYIPVSSQDTVAVTWPLVEAEETFFLHMPKHIFGYAAVASAPIPGNYAAVQADIAAAIHDPDLWQSVQIALLSLMLVIALVDRRRIAASVRQLSRSAWDRLVSTARTIIEIDQQPAPKPNSRLRTFEPLLRIAEPVPYDAWPTMATIDFDCVRPARPRPAGPRVEPAAAASTLARYCFYTLNQWGIVDSRIDHSFASDTAALTHAERIAGTGRIEVWRDGFRLGTISGEAGTSDHRRREYA